MSESEWFRTNQAHWDERVPIHVNGRFYDVAGFKSGGLTLREFEREGMGDVTGLDLVHTQCHFGLDTLSWARLGAKVTGLDFSAPAIDAARKLAEDIGIDARFETGNVYDAAEILGTTYDVVYTGLGALNWLPDIERWASTMKSLLRPGGFLYVAEFHPITEVFADETLAIEHSYFGSSTPTEWNEPGTYADEQASTEHNHTYEWKHTVADIMQALLSVGLKLEHVREHDYTLFPRWPFLEKSGRNTYRLPKEMPSLPLMVSMRWRYEG